MKDEKSELDARYRVVNLLYRGDLDSAQHALDDSVRDGILSQYHVIFYQSLLAQARKQSEELRRSTPAFPGRLPNESDSR